MKTSDITGAELDNAIHTHTTDLEITCAGETVIHELRVMYTYTAAISGQYDVRYPSPLFLQLPEISPPVPAQVEIQDIMESRTFTNPELKTDYRLTVDSQISQYVLNSPEHIRALESEILEQKEYE